MTDTLMVFPCEFPIKIIGKATPNFFTEIVAIIRKHFPEVVDTAINNQFSGKANYQSITATVYALDQASLDALYKELTQHPDMHMVL